MDNMEMVKKAIGRASSEMEERERRTDMSFFEFLSLVREDPLRTTRNQKQVLRDMVNELVGKGINEYPDDPESIDYVRYDCSKIFSHGFDQPFFPDRLFANRFVNWVKNLPGAMQNKIWEIEGSHGCGKSTFLINLLTTFQDHTDTEQGRVFEAFWRIDGKKMGMGGDIIEVPCPSHDHPLLVIPRKHRKRFMDDVLKNNETKFSVLGDKEYEWLFRDEACTICDSIFWRLFDELIEKVKKREAQKSKVLETVLSMLYVRAYKFDRRFGEGISVFNSGDKPSKNNILKDEVLQKKIDDFFGSSNAVKYLFTIHAKTKGGIFVLHDVKSRNKDRFKELHNIVSEGVHKVGECVEENANSLFVALMNPEDEEIFDGEGESFRRRVGKLKMSYALDPKTEVKIYRSVYGDRILDRFLPRILVNFARVIVASRMEDDSTALKNWIRNLKKYKSYCDECGKLLRMEIYGGFIVPKWLSANDKKRFTAKRRRRLIDGGEKEGTKGFNGTQSITMFSDFFSRYGERDFLINMEHVCEFFNERLKSQKATGEKVSRDLEFLGSLLRWYDYTVVSEIKEAMFFYNEKQIEEDLLDFLFACNYWGEEHFGREVQGQFTGRKIEINKEYFRSICFFIIGETLDDDGLKAFIEEKDGIQDKYTKQIVSQGVIEPKAIADSEVFRDLHESYTYHLKTKVLEPFKSNENFRKAIKVYGDEEFKTFDRRIRHHVEHMIKKLCQPEKDERFGYTEQGAKEICVYMIDNELYNSYS